MYKTNYSTNLTEKQWQVIENILDNKKIPIFAIGF